jgi:hypothetical protein
MPNICHELHELARIILNNFSQYMTKKGVIQWENGLGGSGGCKRIFLDFFCSDFENKAPKKSVGIRPIRPIRSPIVSHPFLSCTKIIFVKIRANSCNS